MAKRKKVAPVRRKRRKKEVRLKDRRRQKKYTRRVGKHIVFGKKVPSRMIRVGVKYADLLLRKAKRAGLSVPEYTAKLARRQ